MLAFSQIRKHRLVRENHAASRVCAFQCPMTNTYVCVKTVLSLRRVVTKVRRLVSGVRPSSDWHAFQHDWIHVRLTTRAAMADAFPTNEVVFSVNAEQAGQAVDVIKVIDGRLLKARSPIWLF